MTVEHDVLIDRLDEVIRQFVPNVSTVPKYGGTLYTLKPDEKEGQFCGVFPYKDHVQLAFSNGTSLDDPRGLLDGTGKFRRHINYQALLDIDEGAVSDLLKQSAELSIS